MLVHTTPRFYTCAHSGSNVELIDLRIDEWGVFLKGGKDVTTRRPYPNKRYVVACRKVGQKAIDGLFFETGAAVPAFTVVTRWAIRAEFIATHRVHYVVLDSDFEAVTDSMVLWYAMSDGLGGWGSRWPEVHKNAVPASAQPRMVFCPEPPQSGIKAQVTGPQSFERIETFQVPTIERERLLSSKSNERLPSIESAFHIHHGN